MNSETILSDVRRMGKNAAANGGAPPTAVTAFGLYDETSRLMLTGEHLRPITLTSVGLTSLGAEDGSPYWDGKKNRIAAYANDMALIAVPIPQFLQDGQTAILYTSPSVNMIPPVGSTGDGTSAYPISRLLTLSGNAVALETVTVGAFTWTWAASGNGNTTVTVEGTAALSAINLRQAIEAQAEGFLKATLPTSTTVLVEVIDLASMTSPPIATTETMTNASWDDVAMPEPNSATTALTAGINAVWTFWKNPITGILTHTVSPHFPDAPIPPVRELHVYLPNQSSFSGSMAIGPGLRSLVHVSSDDGQDNIAIGRDTGLALTDGRGNTLLGSDNGKALTSASVVNTYSGTLGNCGNTFIGRTIGAAANGALDCTLVGINAGQNLTSAIDDVGIGANALRNIEGGSENVGCGHGTLEYIVGSGDFATGNGHRLTAVGDMAGRFLNSLANKTGGKSCVYLGARTRSLNNTAENEIVIGYDVDGGGSNTIILGNASILATVLRPGVTIGNSTGEDLNVGGYIKSETGIKFGVGSGSIANDSDTTKSIVISADPGNAGANSFLGFNVDGVERMRAVAGLVTVTGKLTSTATTPATLAASATTFAVTSNVATVTGDGGGNTVATITGGVSGMVLTLIFTDALITITDTAANTADTVNLSAAFTSSAADTMTLVHNGTKWFEVARSVN